MDGLTGEQTAELAERLAALRDELKALIESTREGTRPVDLDEPIGRLTRMDAMQQQSMSAANRRRAEVQLRLVERALERVESGSYGLCLRCENPVGTRRLAARPESPFCLSCQDEADRRSG